MFAKESPVGRYKRCSFANLAIFCAISVLPVFEKRQLLGCHLIVLQFAEDNNSVTITFMLSGTKMSFPSPLRHTSKFLRCSSFSRARNLASETRRGLQF